MWLENFYEFGGKSKEEIAGSSLFTLRQAQWNCSGEKLRELSFECCAGIQNCAFSSN